MDDTEIARVTRAAVPMIRSSSERRSPGIAATSGEESCCVVNAGYTTAIPLKGSWFVSMQVVVPFTDLLTP